MRRSSPGQSLVEFALILPLFVLLLVGLFDLGHAVYATSTVNNAAREGARLAVVDQMEVDICAAARSAAVGLDVSTSEPCNINDLSHRVTLAVDYRDPSDPETPDSCAEFGSPTMIGCLAVVSVTYSYSPITPLVGALVGPITLTGESRFPVQNYCQVPPSASCPIGD